MAILWADIPMLEQPEDGLRRPGTQTGTLPIMRPRFPQALFITLLLLCVPIFAAPHTGPYGPVAHTYALPQIQGRLWFVSPEAPDDSPGDALTRPTSLDQALSQAASADAIILRGGTYRTGSLTTNQGPLLQPYLDEKPLIKGTRVAKDWIRQRNGLWRCHWETLFPAAPADWWARDSVGAVTPRHRFNNDLVFVDGRRLRSAGWEGELDQDSFYIDYEAGQIYLAIDPTDKCIEVTAHDGAITRSTRTLNGRAPDSQGLRIRGLGFTQYAYRALEVEGTEAEGPADEATYGKDVTDTLLENVSITHCSRVAAYLRGDRTVVRQCRISDTGTEGLYLIAANDSLLEGNLILRNNVDDIRGYFPAAVKIFNQSHRVTCRDNLVTDMRHSMGIWYDVGNCDAVFIDNRIEQCQFGFFFEISKRALVAGNLFLDCDSGVHVLNSCDVTVVHNTFVNAPLSFERNERSAENDHFGWHPATGPAVDAREGHLVLNNLFAAQKGRGKAWLRLLQAPALNEKLTRSQLATLNANAYIAVGRGKNPGIDFGPFAGDQSFRTLDSLGEMKELAPGFEPTGTTLDTGDEAFFRSWECRDFHPLTPCGTVELLPTSIKKRLETLNLRELNAPRMPGAFQHGQAAGTDSN